jgi:peptidoglycan-associated lipoprotein
VSKIEKETIMRKKSIAICLIMLGGFVFTSGCAKNEMVKKDEAVAQVAKTPNIVKSEPVKMETLTNTPLTQNQIKESAAPDTLQPVTNAAELKAELEKIYFDFDGYALSQTARDTLIKNSANLKKDPAVIVQIEGHCDERGSNEYNLALGERRAKSAMQYLATMGISENRLSVISYGKEKPVAVGEDEASWAKNRRDEFVISTK